MAGFGNNYPLGDPNSEVAPYCNSIEVKDCSRLNYCNFVNFILGFKEVSQIIVNWVSRILVRGIVISFILNFIQIIKAFAIDYTIITSFINTIINCSDINYMPIAANSKTIIKDIANGCTLTITNSKTTNYCDYFIAANFVMAC